MNLKSELTALEQQCRSVPIDEQARLCCALSKRFEKIGEYELAYEALSGFWPDRTRPPRVEGLDTLVKAEVLLRAGALAGWLGRAEQIESSTAISKDLLTESLEIFESLQQPNKVAEARGDLALCYWRDGSYDEARITLREALHQVEQEQVELKVVLLIRAGIVEADAGQFNAAFTLYCQVVPLLEAVYDDAIKGSFHISFALLFRRLATAQDNDDHIDQALIEYAAASFHFERAGNQRYLAVVEINLGFLYGTLRRFQDAHQHLNRARRLLIDLGDVGTVAQVDETRARTMLAEGNLREAERTIKTAVRVLERGGQQALLAEALTTQGTIAARMGIYARARVLLQRAIDVAETCGDLEAAGRARLTIIEELNNQTQPRALAATFHEAAVVLQKSQDVAASRRLIYGSLRTIDALLEDRRQETELPDDSSWTGFSLKREMKKIEARVIQHALRDAGGSVSKASRMLGFKHHQSLISLLDNRHKDLAGLRSTRRQRRRTLISKGPPTKKAIRELERRSAKLAVLYVEDNKGTGRYVQELLSGAGIYTDVCASGTVAWEILKSGAQYDVLVVENSIPGVSGLELVLRVRSTRERRHLPIIMLSADDVEKEAWRAGVQAFLQKPEGVNQLPMTIVRALNNPRKK
jgi:CheY-like chemotaxis protein/tetratricopeptide (TPR) repeat protein